jgi:putative transposase
LPDAGSRLSNADASLRRVVGEGDAIRQGRFSFRLKSKIDVWERSFDSRRILDPADFAGRIRYIHENPVQADIAAQSEDYAFSSAGRQQLVDRPPTHLG